MICITKLSSKKIVPVYTFLGAGGLPVSPHGCQYWGEKLKKFFLPICMKQYFIFICIYLISYATYLCVCMLPFVICDTAYHRYLFVSFLYFSKKKKYRIIQRKEGYNIQIPITEYEQMFTLYHIWFLFWF